MTDYQSTIALTLEILFETSQIRNLNNLNNRYGVEMANREHVTIWEWLPRDSIQEMLSYYEGRDQKVERKIRFILSRYDGMTMPVICAKMGMTVQTGYNWQNAWNRCGAGFLENRKPTGKPSKISIDKMDEILTEIDREQMTTSQARSIIKDRFGVVFTKKHIRTILRKNGFIHPDEYLRGLTKGLYPDQYGRKEKPWVTKETLIEIMSSK